MGTILPFLPPAQPLLAPGAWKTDALIPSPALRYLWPGLSLWPLYCPCPAVLDGLPTHIHDFSLPHWFMLSLLPGQLAWWLPSPLKEWGAGWVPVLASAPASNIYLVFAHLVPALHFVIIDSCTSTYHVPAGVDLPLSASFRGLEVPGNGDLLLALWLCLCQPGVSRRKRECVKCCTERIHDTGWIFFLGSGSSGLFCLSLLCFYLTNSSNDLPREKSVS